MVARTPKPELPADPDPEYIEVNIPQTVRPRTVYEAITRVIADSPAIGKEGQMNAGAGGNYRYRGIEDIMGALKKLVAREGIVFVPFVRHKEMLTRQTRNNTNLYVAQLFVEYHVYGPDGGHLTARVWSEGSDSGDKALAKAMTSAYKQLLNQLFFVADSEGDPDHTASVETVTAPPPAATPPRPTAAPAARPTSASVAPEQSTPQERPLEPTEPAGSPADEELAKSFGYRSFAKMIEVNNPLRDAFKELDDAAKVPVKKWLKDQGYTTSVPVKVSHVPRYRVLLGMDEALSSDGSVEAIQQAFPGAEEQPPARVLTDEDPF